jgi:hypothetical protein
MKKHPRQKVTKTVAVLFSVMMAVVFSQALWAAPKLEQSKAKGGDCAGCHVQKKMLPDKHTDTKSMNWKACKACHNKENLNLTGKLPGSHHHQLADVNCVKCHGKTKTPEALTMEQCVACHGSTAKLAEKTKDVKPTNPHTSPHYGTDLDCNLCHHQHAKSENYCAQCHKFDFKTP